MKRVVIVVVAAVLLAGCGDGPQTTQRRTVPAFHAVEIDGKAKVVITQGPTQSVVVRTGRRHLDDVVMKVKDGLLMVDTDRRISIGPNSSTLTLRITVPRLTDIHLNGAADVVLHRIDGDRLGVQIRGSGDLNGDGHTRTMDISVAGSGDVHLLKLAAEEAKVDIRGSGDLRLAVASKLDASIHGSGSVRYRGEPRVTSNIAGSGEISAVD